MTSVILKSKTDRTAKIAYKGKFKTIKFKANKTVKLTPNSF